MVTLRSIEYVSSTSFDMRIVRYESIHKISPESFAAMVEALDVKDSDRILDCGCGYGAVSREVLLWRDKMNAADSAASFRVAIDLVDESLRQIERAKVELAPWSTNPSVTLSFLQCTFPSASVPKNAYDAIALKMVLHEMPSTEDERLKSGNETIVLQKTFFQELVDRLKPGGRLAVWDLYLTETSRDFFANVMRKKDELAGFQTLVARRHFLTTVEIVTLLEQQRTLVQVRLVKLSAYQFSTKSRLEPELKSDKAKLYALNQHIRTLLECMEPDSRKALVDEISLIDLGDDIQFMVHIAIFRAKKTSDSLFALGLMPDHTVVDTSAPTSNFLLVTSMSLLSANLDKVLASHKGLMRASILTRAKTGSPMLCHEGLDFLYNYTDEQARITQARAYLIYLSGLYCAIKNQVQRDTRSMSDAISRAFQATASAGWLNASLQSADPSIRIEIGAFNSTSGQADVSIIVPT
jgi:SAM-dependent methyltransferase